MRKWKVKPWMGKWGIFTPDGHCQDAELHQADAMDWAWRYCVVDVVFGPDGISRCKDILDKADWWDAYLKAIDDNLKRSLNRAKAVIT